MPKLTTIKIPTTDGIKEAQGFVCWLELAPGKKHKFLLQINEGSKNPHQVTDFATGMKLPGNLQAIQIRNYKSYSRMTARAAAQELVDDIVRQVGIERVMETIQRHEKIN